MTGQGDYFIVGRPSNANWMVWIGGSDRKWGLFGEENRFSTYQEVAEILPEVAKDAWETLRADIACYIAEMSFGGRIGKVYYKGAVVTADFITGSLNSRERELLALPQEWY